MRGTRRGDTRRVRRGLGFRIRQRGRGRSRPTRIVGVAAAALLWCARRPTGRVAFTGVSVSTSLSAAGAGRSTRRTVPTASEGGVSLTGSKAGGSAAAGCGAGISTVTARRRSGHRRLGERRSRHRRGSARRQQAERVDVSVRIGGDAHAEVDVRLQSDCVAALADHADNGPLREGAAALDARRPELEQRHGVAVVSHDRDRAAATGHEADEGDHPARRCYHLAAELRSDVDAAVLACGVWVGADGERAQRPVPRPARSRRVHPERRPGTQ